MLGFTDHDPGEGHYAAGLLAQARAEDRQGWLAELDDVRFRFRAFVQGVSWLVVMGGIGSVLTGLATHDTVLFSSGVTAVVVAFIPRARPVWVYEIAKTWAIKQGWAAVPAGERPLRSPDEILAKRVRPVAEVRRCDEA